MLHSWYKNLNRIKIRQWLTFVDLRFSSSLVVLQWGMEVLCMKNCYHIHDLMLFIWRKWMEIEEVNRITIVLVYCFSGEVFVYRYIMGRYVFLEEPSQLWADPRPPAFPREGNTGELIRIGWHRASWLFSGGLALSIYPQFTNTWESLYLMYFFYFTLNKNALNNLYIKTFYITLKDLKETKEVCRGKPQPPCFSTSQQSAAPCCY